MDCLLLDLVVGGARRATVYRDTYVPLWPCALPVPLDNRLTTDTYFGRPLASKRRAISQTTRPLLVIRIYSYVQSGINHNEGGESKVLFTGFGIITCAAARQNTERACCIQSGSSAICLFKLCTVLRA
jgi:hypothetical protein